MTKKQMKDGRGTHIRQQLRVLQTICSTVDINDIHSSIKPVITKVKHGALDENDEECNLDDYRTIFNDACEAEIEMIRNRDMAKDEAIDEINSTNQENKQSAANEILEKMREDAEKSKDKKYDQMLLFYDRLAKKMVLYDPLNRPILDEDDCDMGTTRD